MHPVREDIRLEKLDSGLIIFRQPTNRRMGPVTTLGYLSSLKLSRYASRLLMHAALCGLHLPRSM